MTISPAWSARVHAGAAENLVRSDQRGQRPEDSNVLHVHQGSYFVPALLEGAFFARGALVGCLGGVGEGWSASAAGRFQVQVEGNM